MVTGKRVKDLSICFRSYLERLFCFHAVMAVLDKNYRNKILINPQSPISNPQSPK